MTEQPNTNGAATPSGSRRVEWIAALVLVAMVAGAGALTLPALRPAAAAPAIDTKLRSGTHLTYVFIAPTSGGNAAFIEAVSKGRDAMREHARRSGYRYSTVAIADEWSVRRGLALLDEFGPFDELIVGRNWLNTGIDKYINSPNAHAGVPQVLVTLQEISVDSIPLRYGPSRELIRLEGINPVLDWMKGGFALGPVSALKAER